MADSDTRAAVNGLYDAYVQRDLERVASYIHDDIDWVIYAPRKLFGFTGPRHGKQAVLEALGEIAKAYALEDYVPKITIVDGDRAAVVSEVTFAQRDTGRVLNFRHRRRHAAARRQDHRIRGIHRLDRRRGTGLGPAHRSEVRPVLRPKTSLQPRQ